VPPEPVHVRPLQHCWLPELQVCPLVLQVDVATHVPLVHVWPDAQQALPHGEPESHVNPHTPSVQVAWPLVTAGQSAAVQHAVFAIQVAVAPVPQALKPLAHSKPHWPPLQTAT
jgi:hypothetical protein